MVSGGISAAALHHALYLVTASRGALTATSKNPLGTGGSPVHPGAEGSRALGGWATRHPAGRRQGEPVTLARNEESEGSEAALRSAPETSADAESTRASKYLTCSRRDSQ
mmetsp:Transcript_18270/g.48847  ORF Transcript_18270/g.48847 Transcript_18270/m.48847 type:complete len:110 (+) Transcript_18270:87-416(+)